MVYDSAETWQVSSSDLIKLSNLNGDFYANLQLLNTSEFEIMISEIKSLVDDGFMLEKVSVHAYDLLKDQSFLAVQAFAAC